MWVALLGSELLLCGQQALTLQVFSPAPALGPPLPSAPPPKADSARDGAWAPRLPAGHPGAEAGGLTSPFLPAGRAGRSGGAPPSARASLGVSSSQPTARPPRGPKQRRQGFLLRGTFPDAPCPRPLPRAAPPRTGASPPLPTTSVPAPCPAPTLYPVLCPSAPSPSRRALCPAPVL